MAVRREVTGANKGARALKKFPSLKRLPSPKISPLLKRLTSLRIFPSLKRLPSLKRFPLAIAGYATRLRKRSQDVLGVIGNIVSPPAKQKREPAKVSEKFYSDISEYAAILKGHASAIECLSKVSQELKEEISRQHKILGDLSRAIEQVAARTDSGLEVEMKPEIISEQVTSAKEELVARLEKGIQIPGHFRYRRQTAGELDMAVAEEEPAKRPCLATRHTLAARELIAKRG